MARPRLPSGNLELPPELVEQVITNIDPTDTRTLCALGLVSQTWSTLSRPHLFSSVLITLEHKKVLRRLSSSTFRSHIREITLAVESDDPWIQNHLPGILEQLPAFTTLRRTHVQPKDAELLPQIIPSLKSLTLAFGRPSGGDFGLPSILRCACAFPLLKRLQITTKAEFNHTGPFDLPHRGTLCPLAHLRMVHLDYPMLNARVLDFLAAPSLDTLHLTLRSDSDSLHACLRAAGPGLRALVLSFPRDPPRDMRTGRLMTPPLPIELRALHLRAPVSYRAHLEIAAHLLERVLAAPYLEQLVIEVEESDPSTHSRFGEYDPEQVNRAREALNRVLQTFPAFQILRISPPL